MIKFLCKDLWTLVFRKQIDNLKTNHRVRFIAAAAVVWKQKQARSPSLSPFPLLAFLYEFWDWGY